MSAIGLGGHLLLRHKISPFGGKAEMALCSADVRLRPKTDMSYCTANVRFWGQNRHDFGRMLRAECEEVSVRHSFAVAEGWLDPLSKKFFYPAGYPNAFCFVF